MPSEKTKKKRRKSQKEEYDDTRPYRHLANYVAMDASGENAIGYLKHIDHIMVRQVLDIWALINSNSEHSYVIHNTKNELIYRAEEDSDIAARYYAGASRGFDMYVYDNYDKKVIHFERHFTCINGEMTAFCPLGTKIGKINQNCACVPKYDILNAADQVVMKVEGPCCASWNYEAEFKVTNLQGQSVGKISKKWAGAFTELFTEVDWFGITFPKDLDYRVKILLIGACLLVDYTYYEH